MNSKAATAWACGTCDKLHSKNKYGKAVADQCCTCPVCKGPCGKWRGSQDIPCEKCNARKNLESARKHFEEQKESLAQAEKVAKRLGVE